MNLEEMIEKLFYKEPMKLYRIRLHLNKNYIKYCWGADVRLTFMVELD